MRVKYLFQGQISKAEPGLWYDHDRRSTDEDATKGWGITFKMFGGDAMRHGLKIQYWPAMWKRELALVLLNGKFPLWVKTRVSRWNIHERFPSAWKQFDPEYHYAARFRFPLLPFVSVSFGPYGAYFGFKVARINRMDRFKPMGIFADSEINDDSEILVFSMTTRRTR